MNRNTLVIEVYSEELPARFLGIAKESLLRFTKQILEEMLFDFDGIESFYTPRRIWCIVKGVSEFSRRSYYEVKGPPKKVSYDNENKPTNVLLKFLESKGATIEDVFIKKEGKGEYVYIKKERESIFIADAVKSILVRYINDTSFPKRMRWGEDFSYPRPIRGILVLFGDKVLNVNLGGITSSNTTYGNYIYYPDEIKINEADKYEDILESFFVIARDDKRYNLIKDAVRRLEEEYDIRAYLKDELLLEIVGILEYPVVRLLEFDKDFLKLPDIVLISEMVEKQRYIPFFDGDRLSNKFAVVFNLPSTKYKEEGALRVLRARFYDALFFYNEDIKKPLFHYVEGLKGVIFHIKLGSIYDKIERMMEVASVFKDLFGIEDSEFSDFMTAIKLCKADLLTNMVYEFPELQGEMGGIYAKEQGLNENIWKAIYEHYRPRYKGDDIPYSKLGKVLSILDKWDNILSLFMVGEIPSGSKDPYGLRRDGNGIVEILYQSKWDIDVWKLYHLTKKYYDIDENIERELYDFWFARIKGLLDEFDFSYDSKNVVLSSGILNPYDIFLRISVLEEVRKELNFDDVMIAFKRVNNIVDSFFKKFPNEKVKFSKELLIEEAEKKLYEEFSRVKPDMIEHINKKEYRAFLDSIAKLKGYVDKYFDEVLVMCDDRGLRNNRIAMLKDMADIMRLFGDFSKIQEV